MTVPDFETLTRQTKAWGKALGFDAVGVTDTDLAAHEARLDAWLAAGRHGEMEYMSRHGARRSRPAELIPGTCRVITTRMNYLPGNDNADGILATDRKAFVSRYALGRDYHKVIRSRLVKLWQHIESWLAEQGESQYTARVFTDSAPVLEKALAEKSGLGWIGKNTLLLNRDAGSWFFLGEIYTNVPLMVDAQQSDNHCGSCRACIDICPTGAIVAPYELDARKCISYLTIEHRGTIPREYRSAMGNRIFGCDDCQMICPWNKYARISPEPDFSPRHQLDQSDLLDLFAWSEEDFLKRTEGSAIRRTGYCGWLRNIAIALGNGRPDPEVISALYEKKAAVSDMVAEHIGWAIEKLENS
jgi:epoxyqueuosine reductase